MCMNKQQLASKIWESANEMRSKIDANEYKDYILGFIFYKFLSDKLIDNLIKNGLDNEEFENELKEENTSIVEFCQRNYGYFIAYDNLFSTWLSKGSDFDVSNVRDALGAFDRLISKNKSHEKVYKEIFVTLQTGLSNLGSTASEQTKAIVKLIHLIDEIPMNGQQDYDVLGFVYEYLISMFAANAGKKAGEFYTPHEVSLLMSEIVAHHLKNHKNIEIYDPTSGSGSLLINIGSSVAKHMKDSDKIKYYAQELKKNTYNLTRMNLVMRGIKPDNIVTRNADTLEQDWPYIDENNNYAPLYVDAVVSNPPYSQKWDPTNKDSDPRYADYGLAPKSKADYAFLLHDLFHVKPDGIMTIVLPHGVLFRGGSEGEIREKLIEKNNIDTIIGLPANIFFGTGIPTIIMILKHPQSRENTDVLVIDASKGFVKDGTKNKLQSSDIRKIVDTVNGRLSIEKYSKLVSRNEIRENEYNLNIPRYVDSSEEIQTWDIYSTMFGGVPNEEIEKMSEYWEVFPELKDKIFKPLNEEYSDLTEEDLSKVIEEDIAIRKFKDDFLNKFSDFDSFLYSRTINNLENPNIGNEKQIISNELFKRLEATKLIDKYDAYQLFSNVWEIISLDLETINIEGNEVLTKVNPNMVTKKRSGQNVEVQEGYVGAIIPFEITQKRFFLDEIEDIENKENRINEIASSMEELFENLDEEAKENEFINEDKTSFINAEVIKYVKQLQKDTSEDDEVDTIIRKVHNLILEERKLKREVKADKDSLHLQTKAYIEKLNEEEVTDLLTDKWITPIVESINNLVNQKLTDFVYKINELSNKYKETLIDIDNKIKTTSKDLYSMLEELTGDEFSLKGIEEFKKSLKGE